MTLPETQVKSVLESVFGGVLTPGPHVPPDRFQPKKPGSKPPVNARELRSYLLGLPWTSFPDEPDTGSLLDVACHSVEGCGWGRVDRQTAACLPFATLGSAPAPLRGVHWMDRVRERLVSEVVPGVVAALSAYLGSLPDPDTSLPGQRKGGATRSDIERVQRVRSVSIGLSSLGNMLTLHGSTVLPSVLTGATVALATFPPGVVLFTSGKSKKDVREAIRETVAGMRSIQVSRGPWEESAAGRSRVQAVLDAGVGSFAMVYTAAGPQHGTFDDVLERTAQIVIDCVRTQ